MKHQPSNQKLRGSSRDPNGSSLRVKQVPPGQQHQMFHWVKLTSMAFISQKLLVLQHASCLFVSSLMLKLFFVYKVLRLLSKALGKFSTTISFSLQIKFSGGWWLFPFECRVGHTDTTTLMRLCWQFAQRSGWNGPWCVAIILMERSIHGD